MLISTYPKGSMGSGSINLHIKQGKLSTRSWAKSSHKPRERKRNISKRTIRWHKARSKIWSQEGSTLVERDTKIVVQVKQIFT